MKQIPFFIGVLLILFVAFTSTKISAEEIPADETHIFDFADALTAEKIWIEKDLREYKREKNIRITIITIPERTAQNYHSAKTQALLEKLRLANTIVITLTLEGDGILNVNETNNLKSRFDWECFETQFQEMLRSLKSASEILIAALDIVRNNEIFPDDPLDTDRTTPLQEVCPAVKPPENTPLPSDEWEEPETLEAFQPENQPI